MSGRRASTCGEVDTIEVLNLFMDRARELGETRLLRSGGLQSRTQFQWSAQERCLRGNLASPDEDDLRSFLLTFRQFISKDEPVFLGRIFNLLHQQVTDEEIRKSLGGARRFWRKCAKGRHFRLIIDDVEMTPGHVQDMILNARYFHSNGKYRQELSQLPPFERILTYTLFFDSLANITRVIYYVGNVVIRCFDEGLLRDAGQPRSAEAAELPITGGEK